MTKLIEQYETQIKLLEERVSKLMQELNSSSGGFAIKGGYRDEMYVRIKILNQEIDDMWDSINMMKGY